MASMLCALVSGCGIIGSKSDPEYSTLGGGADRVNSAGVHELFGGGFERVDLVQLLVPQGLRDDEKAKCAAVSDITSESYAGCLVDKAFTRYHADDRAIAPAVAASSATRDTPMTRNVIQDRIIAASNQRCNVFLNYIQRHQAATNFTLGSLTSLLAGSGAIATGATTARALAGSAGIVSSVRAEYDQTYFYNQTVSIISKGIRQRRKTLLAEIDARRNTEPGNSVVAYTIERAVSDALVYHGACTIMAGLEETNTSLSLDAGLDDMKAKLTKQNALRELLQKVAPAATSASEPTPPAPAASGAGG